MFGNEYYPPVVLYTPIEGSPIPNAHCETFEMVEALNGIAVLYCNSAKERLLGQYPHLTTRIEICGHGVDHAHFRKYSEDDRRIARELVGLQDKFVIGSVGANKRTKGFPTLIYAARYLREVGEDSDVIFYCHCNPRDETMWGYKLEEMAIFYGVRDMFLFKPKPSTDQRNYWLGFPLEKEGILDEMRQLEGKIPPTPKGRGFIFLHYDMVTMYNCMDLYVDASQIEGWGLPACEAMACGVPIVSIHDKHVRDEIHSAGAYMIDPLPSHMWETWHTTARLVSIDPHVLGQAIIEMKNDSGMRERYSTLGQKAMARYRWQDAGEQIARLIIETFNKDQSDIARVIKELRKEKDGVQPDSSTK